GLGGGEYPRGRRHGRAGCPTPRVRERDAGSATPVSAPLAPSRRDEARRFGALVFTLAVTEWKLRFFGSVLGYMWTLVRPLMFFGVLYLVFTEIAKVGNKIPDYKVVLLTGIVLYQFFAEATTLSVTCLVDRETLLRKARFP